MTVTFLWLINRYQMKKRLQYLILTYINESWIDKGLPPFKIHSFTNVCVCVQCILIIFTLLSSVSTSHSNWASFSNNPHATALALCVCVAHCIQLRLFARVWVRFVYLHKYNLVVAILRCMTPLPPATIKILSLTGRGGAFWAPLSFMLECWWTPSLAGHMQATTTIVSS